VRKETKILGIAAFGFLAAIVAMAFWPERKEVFIPLAGGLYAVKKAQFITGTNIIFDPENPLLPWSRRQLDKVGLHLKGSRRTRQAWEVPTGRQMYVIRLLCEGDGRGVNWNQEVALHTIQVADENGRKVELKGRSFTAYSSDQFWLYWSCDQAAWPKCIGYPGLDITNLVPAELRVIRSSDTQEVARITLSD
jgi:hypothetical protein